MSESINTIDKLGDDVAFKQIVERTITEFVDTEITQLGEYALMGCKSLTKVDLHNVTLLRGWSLNGCSSLTALVIRSNALCTMENSYVFTNNAIASGKGYVYVPREFLSDTDSAKDYRRATNWSKYNRFRVLEDYTVDGTTTGELDPNKI